MPSLPTTISSTTTSKPNFPSNAFGLSPRRRSESYSASLNYMMRSLAGGETWSGRRAGLKRGCWKNWRYVKGQYRTLNTQGGHTFEETTQSF